MSSRRSKTSSVEKNNFPLLIINDYIHFPHSTRSISILSKSQIKVIETSMEAKRSLYIAYSRVPRFIDLDDKHFTATEFSSQEICKTITHCKIVQVFKSSNGTLRVLLEGQKRFKLLKTSLINEVPFATAESYPENKEIAKKNIEYMNLLKSLTEEYMTVQKTHSHELVELIKKAETPDKMVDLICGHSRISYEDKLEILIEENTQERLEKTAAVLQTEIELLHLQRKIKNRVMDTMEKKQREYFLNEQIREINKELGRTKEDADEFSEYEKKIKEKSMPEEIEERAKKELSRLTKLQAASPESGILKFYLDWLLELPWTNRKEEHKDIKQASKILDEDHYDLEKPKERILDFIAVRQLTQNAKGPILCFVGPPGTGKTSLGRSVAKAIGRDFVRISLGGVKDESEIRGHRRTYVGALPGKIIQSMKKAGSINPVFLLDEIDKMSNDFRGDPSSAMLEVLDPEQNSTFSDHYLEVPYDLSQVMFIATANNAHRIPAALRDRMEIIEIPGYSNIDKIKIAQNFIIPKQIQENGLPKNSINFNEGAISEIIESYTMESGVRNLERQIATIIRKCARQALEENLEDNKACENKEAKANKEPIDIENLKRDITKASIKKFLGPKKITRELLYPEPKIGLVNGLAWTEVGGTILPIEVTTYHGTGKLILTGSLGDVMKESAQTALSFIRSNSQQLGIPHEMHKDLDIHIHVPEGAIPKDGPSAGITMATALISFFKKTPTMDSIAMTGELTLTGRILPVGGIKEKVLAAYIHNIKTVFLPTENKKDLADVPKEVKSKIKFVFNNSIIDALYKIFPKGTFEDGENNDKSKK